MSLGNKEVFGRNLSRYLDMWGKEQKEVAEAIGVSTSVFSDWVRGKTYPRIDKIEKLANYFGIQKSDLIEIKEEKKSPEEPKLTEGEQMLIHLFRQVPEEQQQLVLQMIRAALGTKG